jgi:nucleotide-binding universal stress UspA family protein
MDILYATDGLPPAKAAAALLTRLAEPAFVDVTALNAFSYRDLVARRQSDRALADAEATLGGAGIPCHLLAVDGDAATAIEKELAGGDEDLVVLGAGNHSWLGRAVVGSVSTHVLHHVACPVIVVHRSPADEGERVRVLVGADGSRVATLAIDVLVQLTDPERVDIDVRTVVPMPQPILAADLGGPIPMGYVDTLAKDARADAPKHLEAAVERFRSAGFPCAGSISEGWPATELMDHAERSGADLVVVGARGLGVFERLTLGSVSAHVVRHAPATLVAHAAENAGMM